MKCSVVASELSHSPYTCWKYIDTWTLDSSYSMLQLPRYYTLLLYRSLPSLIKLRFKYILSILFFSFSLWFGELVPPICEHGFSFFKALTGNAVGLLVNSTAVRGGTRAGAPKRKPRVKSVRRVVSSVSRFTSASVPWRLLQDRCFPVRENFAPTHANMEIEKEVKKVSSPSPSAPPPGSGSGNALRRCAEQRAGGGGSSGVSGRPLVPNSQTHVCPLFILKT